MFDLTCHLALGFELFLFNFFVKKFRIISQTQKGAIVKSPIWAPINPSLKIKKKMTELRRGIYFNFKIYNFF